MRTLRIIAVAALLAGTAVVASASASQRTDTGGAGVVRLPLRYGPTWLPDGYVERERTLSSWTRDHAAIGRDFELWYRMWWPSSLDPDRGGGFLLMSFGSDSVGDPTCVGGQAIVIDGRPAVHVRQGDKACVHWLVGPNTRIRVKVEGDGVDPDDALRVARSVRPVDGDVVVPFRLQRLDFEYGDSADTGLTMTITGTSPDDWTAWIAMGPESKSQPRGMSITLGTTTRAPPGGSLPRVGRRQGRLVAGEGYPKRGFLVLEVGPHLLLTVEYWCQGCTEAELESQLKVAERVRVTNPDTLWIGSR
jgi:hypothetical protein